MRESADARQVGKRADLICDVKGLAIGIASMKEMRRNRLDIQLLAILERASLTNGFDKWDKIARQEG